METTPILEHSPELNEIAKALAAAQGEFKAIVKENLNPHLKSRYADLQSYLSVCRPSLSKHGISVLQSPSCRGNIATVTTLLLHTSGQWIKGSLELQAKATDPQSIGSAFTYGKRYAIGAMLAVAGQDEDDDAEIQMERPQPQTQASAPTPPAAPVAPTDKADSRERLRKMVEAFKGKGVTQGQLAKFLGHALPSTTDKEMDFLLTVFTEIEKGSPVSRYFKDEPSQALNAKFQAKG